MADFYKKSLYTFFLINNLKISLLLIRSLIGFIFIASTLLKLISIDSFEIYVYSLGLLNLELSLIFVRLLLAFELILGLMLLFGVYTKQTVWISIIVLFGFTVFISSLIINNEAEHCHCFGDKIQLNHYQSIIKNIILISLLFLVRNTKDFFKIFKAIQTLGIVIFSLTLISIISPPDNFLRKSYDKKTTFQEESLHQYLNESQTQSGKHIISFMSPKCHFCDLASRKLEIILSKIESDYSFKMVFWGEETTIKEFINNHNFGKFDYDILPPNYFLKITDGKMPLILLVEDGEVVQKYGYRNLNEREILRFFND